jgi:assimilatory nitrate reductase catalytic subunit
MNLKRLIGIDNLRDDYAYARSESTGYTSAKKIPEKWVATTCGYCSVGCGMEIGVKEGKAVAARPQASHPVNRGKLCPKGLSEHYIIDTENRAKHPLLRKNGKLTPVGWDEALSTMVEKFHATQAKYGPASLGVLSTGQLVTEEFYALGKLVQLGFGTNNYDGNTTLCMASAVSGYKLSFGSDGPPGAYEDIEKADVVLLIGANIADNHPILCQYLDTNPRQTLIVADPRVSKTAMIADLHLPLKPRSDLALLNGIAHILIRHGLIDRAYVDRHTTGFDALEKFLEAYTPERVAEITGLSEPQLYQTAVLFGRAKNGFIGWTMGVNHSTKGTETVNAICNLSLLTGRSAAPDRRRSPSPDSATRWARERPASPAACQGIASTIARPIAPSLRRFGASTSRACRSSAGWPIPTSWKARSRVRSARYGLSRPIRWCPSPIRMCCARRSAISTFWWYRTATIRRRLPSSRIWCCPLRSGVRKKVHTPTPSGG